MSISGGATTTTATNLKLVPTITNLLHTLNPPNPLNSTTPTPSPSSLNHLIPHLTPTLLIQTINSQTSPYHSLFFFNFFSSHLPPSHHSYIAITDHLLSHHQFSLAKHLLITDRKFSDFFVGKLIKAHGDLGQTRSAVKLFHQRKRRGRFSYNALLGVLVKHDMFSLALGYFGEMIKGGLVVPDVGTYTIMIRGFCKVGLVEVGKRVFDEMDCEKNLVCCNTMVNGFVKKGDMESAKRVVEDMVEGSVEGCMPDVVTYGTLIDGYCKKGEVGEGMRCFDEMIERGCDANELVYNALINGFCSNGKVDEAMGMMGRMRLRGLRDDLKTHTSLLKGYCIAGRSEDAIRHFKEMVRLNLKMDGKAFMVIVKECCKLKRADEALALMEDMRARDVNPSDSVAGFNAVLRCLVQLGEPNRAFDVLMQMRTLNCEPNFLSYSTVLCGLSRAKGMIEEIEVLVTDMRQNGKSLDATLYNCLIRAFCGSSNSKMALQIFQEMIEESYLIDLESFTVLVKELCSKGEVFEVEKVYERMSQSYPSVSLETYERILNHSLRGIGVN